METIENPTTQAPRKKLIARTILTLPQVICCHLFGEDHPIRHRIIVGIIFAVIGTLVTKGAGMISSEVIKITGDALGLSLHGIGLSPIIERMAKK